MTTHLFAGTADDTGTTVTSIITLCCHRASLGLTGDSGSVDPLAVDCPDARWRDTQGDVWAVGVDGLMHSFETASFPREVVERKWGPLVLESHDSEMAARS